MIEVYIASHWGCEQEHSYMYVLKVFFIKLEVFFLNWIYYLQKALSQAVGRQMSADKKED